jgi:hypothetical protein
MAYVGHHSDNYFTLDRGDYWRAYGEDGQVFPSYAMLLALHKELTGGGVPSGARAIRETPITIYNTSGVPVQADALGVVAFTPVDLTTRRVIVVCNLSVSETVKPNIIGLGISSASACKTYTWSGNYKRHNRYAVGYRAAQQPVADGAGQSGTTLAIREGSFDPVQAGTFTIDGDATVYTATNSDSFFAPSGSITITPTLAATPADGAQLTFSGVSGGMAPDNLCVEIAVTGVSKTVPSNLDQIVVDDALGATASGLEPGTSMIIVLDGVA